MEAAIIEKLLNFGLGGCALGIVFYLCIKMVDFLKAFIAEMQKIAASLQLLANNISGEHEHSVKRQEVIISKLDAISTKFEQQVSRCSASSKFQ